MTIETKPAVAVVNGWLFSRPEVESIYSYSGGFTNAPVYPMQEPVDIDSPYILYNTRPVAQQGTMWWINKELVSFIIYDTDLSRLFSAVRTIINYMRRYDDSGKEMHSWSVGEAGMPSVRMLTSNLVEAFDVLEPDQEGGVYAQKLVFEICYVESSGIGIS